MIYRTFPQKVARYISALTSQKFGTFLNPHNLISCGCPDRGRKLMSFPRKRESHEIQEIPAYARMTNKGFSMQERKPVIIMGAAGRDFHNFNTFFRNSEKHNVVAFTATQIPKIADRVYPPSLAGSLYPKGIPIYPEKDLSKCHGRLKEELQAIIINKLHTYIIENIGEFRGNLTSV